MKTQLYQQGNKAVSTTNKKHFFSLNSRISLTLFALIFMLPLGIFAQSRVVYGEVSVFKNLRLQNIVIESKKTGAKSITDSTGSFTIVCKPRDVLFFRNEAFEPQKIRVKPKTDSVFVNLEFVKDDINEALISIGYGYTTKTENAYAHSNLTPDKVDFCKYNNIYELIKGRFPGVSVTATNNSPGSEQEILIRGKGSINASTTPLYIVDGSIMNTLIHINPCDVQSIDVLKDGSAAIYGSKGANGVIIIETR
ncbi:MAG: TonB-dependent receptor plug domain-containing protein [Prolixibacteraceae bacterium]|jgi:TonB-dependent SusC/RagA subfamily outer membrane receptor|nr:TonB-dependent receptor plug domain-containing protein [Prolixibacteraceae bacterium]